MTNETMLLINNIVTILSLIDFSLKILKWSRNFMRKKSGDNITPIEKKFTTKQKLKSVFITLRMILPLVLSSLLVVWDMYSSSPIDKIFVIRICLNVSIIVSNILFVIVIKQIDKAKKSTIDETTALMWFMR